MKNFLNLAPSFLSLDPKTPPMESTLKFLDRGVSFHFDRRESFEFKFFSPPRLSVYTATNVSSDECFKRLRNIEAYNS